jgi:hypothetical protein
VNLYAYAGNNPISFDDPFGLCDKLSDPTCVTFMDQLSDRISQAWNNGLGALMENVGKGLKALADVANVVLPGSKKVSESLAGSTFEGERLNGSQQVSALAGGLGEAGMGMAAGGFTEATLAKVSKQLAEHGAGSLQKSLKSLTNRIAEHTKDIAKYKAAGGYTSSMEREVKAMQGEVNAINHVLNGPQ